VTPCQQSFGDIRGDLLPGAQTRGGVRQAIGLMKPTRIDAYLLVAIGRPAG
jgi:hypothetical protein